MIGPLSDQNIWSMKQREENEGSVLNVTGKEENFEVLDRQRTKRSKKERRGDFGKRKFHRNLQLFWVEFCFPFSTTQVFSPSVYVDVALQKQLEELLNSCYYIPSKEEASKVEVISCWFAEETLLHSKQGGGQQSWGDMLLIVLIPLHI